MVKIYLLRHGQTQDNVDKRHQSNHTPLNEIGFEQAKTASENLKNLKITAIYSSPFTRAMQTAKTIVEYHDHLNIKEVYDLRERYFGKYTGLTREDVLKIAPDLMEQWYVEGVDWKAPGSGESMRELQSRVVKAFREIADSHTDENIIMISHGGAIMTLLSYFLDIPIENVFDIRQPANCEIIEIDWHKGKPIDFSYE